MAAELVRPEDVNFMARYGRGLICLTLTRDRCRQLRLPLMVSETDLDRRTNFTVSIEAAEGVTTGISAYDRAHTIRTAVRFDARAEDLRQPGSHLSADGAAGRGAESRRSYRGRVRSRAPRGSVAVRCHRRDPERRRLDGETSRSREVRAEARTPDRHDCRPDPLPAREGALGRAHRRARGRHGLRAVPALLLRGSRQRHGAPGARPRAGSTGRRRRWSASTSRTPCATWSVPASRGTAGRCAARCNASPTTVTASSCCCVRSRARSRSPRRCAARTAGVRRSRPCRRRAGAADLRHRRADPARPRVVTDAGALRAAADAGTVGVRARGRRIRG